ncbi:YeaC family protein [Shewanella sp. NIFS-20-20]|uniref:YeaC family protein n=1 Tax=Shewanella sp. NIFS-20-20 TaxID=2853806 RepID=UPI001C456BC3|nr:DUF1315 family protein [Shewanella sp. NIFS-20-20]MBV7315220.1 DUF1315 family protein [Shewanella sp. NIFS-20-20]
MKNVETLIEQMPNEVYQRLLTATEIGKWEDGSVLTEAQRDHSLQLVMLYQAKHLQLNDHLTIGQNGQLNELSKSELKKSFRGDSIAQFKESEL